MFFVLTDKWNLNGVFGFVSKGIGTICHYMFSNKVTLFRAFCPLQMYFTSKLGLIVHSNLKKMSLNASTDPPKRIF